MTISLLLLILSLLATGLAPDLGPVGYIVTTVLSVFGAALYARAANPIKGFPKGRFEPATLENTNIAPGLVLTSGSFSFAKLKETSHAILNEGEIAPLSQTIEDTIGIAAEFGSVFLVVCAIGVLFVILALSLIFARESNAHKIRVIYGYLCNDIITMRTRSWSALSQKQLIYVDTNGMISHERSKTNRMYWIIAYVFGVWAWLIGFAISFL